MLSRYLSYDQEKMLEKNKEGFFQCSLITYQLISKYWPIKVFSFPHSLIIAGTQIKNIVKMRTSLHIFPYLHMHKHFNMLSAA
jgi:hypothetical protein